jgi:hypothetical protein
MSNSEANRTKETKQAADAAPEVISPGTSADVVLTEPKLSLSDLSALVTAVAAAMKTASAEQASVLAYAFAESRKPYVDPKQEENQRNMQEQMRRQARDQRLGKIAEQDSCPHLQGSSPMSAETTGNKSSFCLLKLPTGEVIGVCSNCQKVISNRHPKHLVHFKKKGGNELASSGTRDFGNGEVYQRASTHTVVERDEV